MPSPHRAHPATDRIAPASSTSHTLQAGGLRLHYIDYGTAGAAPMLCVHGSAAHGHWYDFVAGAFNAKHHVLALDQRGHGESEWGPPNDYIPQRYAADLAEVVEQLDLRDFVLMGHSMGGMVTLVYAATYPGRIARLIIVDSTLRLTEERAAAMRERGRREPSFASREELIARYKLVPGASTAAPELVRHVAQFADYRHDDGRWRHKFDRNIYKQRRSVDGMQYLARLRIPVLIVKGSLSDRITPEIHADAKAHCPQVEVAEVAASGHHAMLDNPQGFASAVNAFLARHA